MISRQVLGVVQSRHEEQGLLSVTEDTHWSPGKKRRKRKEKKKKTLSKTCDVLEKTHLIAEIYSAGQRDGVVELLGCL